MQISKKFPLSLNSYFFDYIIIALLAILYSPLIFHWYDGWLNKNISIEHEYFSHGVIGLPFAIYICWLQRKKWHKLAERVHPLGFFLFSIGGLLYTTGVPELVNLSFPLVLGGICLWLKGIPGFKLQSFPLLLVLLATPNSLPYLITPLTLPLQKFIAVSAGFILMQFGLDITVEQIYLAVGGRLVEVAPYCAGLKMLFTSLYVGLMLLYWTGNLSDRRRTSLLLVGAAAISITANIIRNTILTCFHGIGKDKLFTWLHDGWGGDLYSAMMLGTIILLLKFIEKLEEQTER